MGKSSRKKSRAVPSGPKTVSVDSALEADIQQVYSHAVELHLQGKFQEAAKLYQMILGNKPDHADSLHYLGVIAHQNGDLETACALIKKAIHINSRAAIFHYNLATMLQEDGQLGSAIKHYKKAIKLQPDYVKAYSNLATIYHAMENEALAKQANLSALKLDPKNIDALHNMGTLLNEAGQYDEAIKYFNKVVLFDPMHTEARYKRAHIQLLRGEFENGWQGYAWMFFSDSFLESNKSRLIPFPKWGGGSLRGKRLLVNADQGIGDELMFASCLPDVIKNAESVVVECDSRLLSLYQRSFSGIDFIPIEKKQDFYWHRGLGDIDYKVNLSGLAQFFRKTEEDFPKAQGYIHSDKSKLADWRNRLKALDGAINIGISWRGGANDRTKKARSIPLNFWKGLSSVSGVNLISLQYGQHDQEIQDFNQQSNRPLHRFDDIDPLTDLDGFSALIASLDLVISIDNSTVHFAGALGTPVWILLPHTPDWRWMLNRRDSLWYPSATLYRAEKMGLESLRKQLNNVVKDLGFLAGSETVSKSDFLISAVAANDKREVKIENNNVLTMKTESESESDYALLLNDTSNWYHWGCSCTSLAIHYQLRKHWDSIVSIPIMATRQLAPFPDNIEQFDSAEFFDKFCASNPDLVKKLRYASAVFINGEGTLHRLNQATLGLLFLAYMAKTKLGKRVSIINHSCYPDGDDMREESPAYEVYQKVYQAIDYIAVREAISVEEVKKMNVPVVQSFDCLPLFVENLYNNRSKKVPSNGRGDIVIAGSVSWNDETIGEIASLIKRLHQEGFNLKLLIGASANIAGDDSYLVRALQESLAVCCELVFACSEDEWLSTIENAQLLISGRFHHSIAAAFLKTPFIVMGSNTPKIKGMLEMVNIKNFVSVEEKDLAVCLYNEALTLVENPDNGLLKDNIKESTLALAMKNFEFLS